MHTFCTIISSDYAHFALTLHESYRRFMNVPMQVLCIDHVRDVRKEYTLPEAFFLSDLDDMILDETGQGIISKYRNEPDSLRWSLKSVWLKHLLSTGGYQKAIYVDPDFFFTADPGFLFGEMHDASILLSPHWRSTDPRSDPFNFELNFRDGIYNGGFLGAASDGVAALEWLAQACLYRCEIDFQSGLFYDQKYLDLLQSRFPGVKVFRHHGCNVANWNQIDCKRIKVGDQVMINGTDPIICIHFSKSTILGIRDGSDVLLLPYLDEYESMIRRFNPSYTGPVKQNNLKPRPKPGILRRVLRKFIAAR